MKLNGALSIKEAEAQKQIDELNIKLKKLIQYVDTDFVSGCSCIPTGRCEDCILYNCDKGSFGDLLCDYFGAMEYWNETFKKSEN